MHRPSEVKVWAADTGRLRFRLTGHEGGVYCVGFSPDGARLISIGGGTLKIWDMTTGGSITDGEVRVDGRQNWLTLSPNWLALSSDGHWTATTGLDRDVIIRELNYGKVVHTLQGHTGELTGLVFSPDGKRLATTAMDRTVKVWDTTDGQETITLRGHTNGVNGVAFSPDGRKIVSTGMDGTVRVWDATPWVEPAVGPSQESKLNEPE